MTERRKYPEMKNCMCLVLECREKVDWESNDNWCKRHWDEKFANNKIELSPHPGDVYGVNTDGKWC